MTGFALVVGGAVVDDLKAPTTLLAARRTEPEQLAGGWELPGGKVEPGEEPLAALHRELAEELGVRVEVGDEVGGPDPHLPGWPLPPAHRMRVWLVRVVEGEPAPLEAHDELRTLPAGGWLDVGWLPADVPVVHALIALAARDRPAPDRSAPDGSAPGADGAITRTP
ncbi:MAG TPA: (deoxy)nucleoside triphosphate pyrophosphohydrolase [Kineosporiaceae bacterium]